MLSRKHTLDATRQNPAHSTMERSRLQQARTLALRRQDQAEVAVIDVKLAEIAASMPSSQSRTEESSDLLAKLNERNRKLNMEQVRKAERAELERKRRERERRAGTATPTQSALEAAGRFKAKMLGAKDSRSVLFFFEPSEWQVRTVC